MINEVVKNGSTDQVQDLISVYLEIVDTIHETSSLAGNTLLRKLRTKLMSKMATRILPAPKIRRRDRTLDGSTPLVQDQNDPGDHEIPEVVETLLQYLFDALQDKVNNDMEAIRSALNLS